MARPDPKLFIVWSSKYKYIAEQIHDKLLEKRKTGFPVYPIMFNIRNLANANSSLHTSLTDLMNSADYALVLMTPDEEVLRRENGSSMGGFYYSSRPNVYFEYGYLSKHLSENKIFVYTTYGSVAPSDTSSLITNSMKVPSTFDEIIKLPEKIVKELEDYFSKEQSEFYLDLDKSSYEIKYSDMFYDITKKNNNTQFVINSSINLGKYWRFELDKFPKDPYHIGRKLIYIIERLPFNVYLYASPHSTNSYEHTQRFIDSEVINSLKNSIDSFLKTIDDPLKYKDYMVYKSSLRMLQVIEKYQSKRNDSIAFSFKEENKYTEEKRTLIEIEEYLPKFPLSKMLFYRYLALCLHKNTMTCLNIEDNNLVPKIEMKKLLYGSDYEKSKFFIGLLQLSMALTYIEKTVALAETYDTNNASSLHKCLAVFDKARLEYVFKNLLIKTLDIKDSQPTLCFETLLNLYDVEYFKYYIEEIISSKIKEKLRKHFNLALINFFDYLIKRNLLNKTEKSQTNNFNLEVIDQISNEIIELIMADIPINDSITEILSNMNIKSININPINKTKITFDSIETLITSSFKIDAPSEEDLKNKLKEVFKDSIINSYTDKQNTIDKISVIVNRGQKDNSISGENIKEIISSVLNAINIDEYLPKISNSIDDICKSIKTFDKDVTTNNIDFSKVNIKDIFNQLFSTIGINDDSNQTLDKTSTAIDEYIKSKLKLDTDLTNRNILYNEWKNSDYKIIIAPKNEYAIGKCKNCTVENKNELVNKIKIKILESINDFTKSKSDKLEIQDIYLNEQSLSENTIRALYINELKLFLNELFKELNQNILNALGYNPKLNPTPKSYTEKRWEERWEESIDKSAELRYDLWVSSKSWPPNMRCILLYEYYHSLSDKYILKINSLDIVQNLLSEKPTTDFDTKLNTFIKESSNTAFKTTLIQASNNDKQFEKSHTDKIKKLLIEIDEENLKNKPSKEIRIELISFLINIEKLYEIKLKLEYSKEIMEFNYEIPDLFNNVLEKIKKSLGCMAGAYKKLTMILKDKISEQALPESPKLDAKD